MNRNEIREAKRINQKRRRLVRSFRIIDEVGPNCASCDKGVEDGLPYTSLECNHINPKDKKFSISDNKMMKWDKLVPELKKCELLCSPCHSEVTRLQRLTEADIKAGFLNPLDIYKQYQGKLLNTY